MRKFLTLIVGGSIAAVLLIAAAVFLLSSMGKHGKVAAELADEQRQLEQLNQRRPYPSTANEAVEQENLDLIKSQYQGMLRKLSGSVIDVPRMTPSNFNAALIDVSKRVRDKANDAQVAIPAQFSLGFNRYSVEGRIPEGRHVHRLLLQLTMLEDVANVLLSSDISAITGTERQMFDTESSSTGGEGFGATGFVGRRGRRGRSQANAESGLPVEPREDDQGLYTSERFVLTFTCKESALWDVMAKFANHPRIIAVRDLVCTSPLELGRAPSPRSMPGPTGVPGGGGPSGVVAGTGYTGIPGEDVGEPMTGETGRDGKIIYPPRENRVVAGRESINVRMELEVFQLLDTAQEPEPEQEMVP